MSANNTKVVFDTTASTYDADRSRLIPGCDAFYRWAIDLIPGGAKNILELGAGSGLLTVLIRNRFPHARIHLIDFSGPMLELARSRLGDDANITYQQADYVPRSHCPSGSAPSSPHSRFTTWTMRTNAPWSSTAAISRCFRAASSSMRSKLPALHLNSTNATRRSGSNRYALRARPSSRLPTPCIASGRIAAPGWRIKSPGCAARIRRRRLLV